MKEQILKQLNWRYATKSFDTSKKLTEEQVDFLKETMRLTPSSYGLQPWKFIEVKSPELREKIKANAWGQSQVTDASTLFVLARNTEFGENDVEAHLEKTASVRGVGMEALEGYRQALMGFVSNVDAATLDTWTAKQLYIVLGQLLTVVAMMEIDACPMEGFDKKAVSEVLGLPEMNLEAVLLCPVGYRSETDPSASQKKVRFDKEDLFITL